MPRGESKIWNEIEDSAIQNLVEVFGEKNWILISEKLAEKYGITDKTAKQCRDRWHNHLNPGLKKEAWTKEEEKILFEQQKIHGNKWSEISKHLPGRSDNSIKNQFYSTIRRNFRKYNKTKPVAEKLCSSIKDLLRDPVMANIMINYDEIVDKQNLENKKKPRKQRAKKPPIPVVAYNPHSIPKDSEEQAENPSLLFEMDELRKFSPIEIETVKPVELKIDSATPISSINSGTPLIGYTPTFRQAHVFNFPDDALSAFNWDSYNNADLDGIHGSDSLTLIPDVMPIKKSASLQGIVPEPLNFLLQIQSQHVNSFILPPFSPVDSFQHCASRNNQ